MLEQTAAFREADSDNAWGNSRDPKLHFASNWNRLLPLLGTAYVIGSLGFIFAGAFWGRRLADSYIMIYVAPVVCTIFDGLYFALGDDDGQGRWCTADFFRTVAIYSPLAGVPILLAGLPVLLKVGLA